MPVQPSRGDIFSAGDCDMREVCEIAVFGFLCCQTDNLLLDSGFGRRATARLEKIRHRRRRTRWEDQHILRNTELCI